MEYKPIRCNSLLNRITKKDRLFHGSYTLDPYQNCEYSCKYCDSSSYEKIYVKTNAVQLLKKELKKIEKKLIIVGSVVDPYQKAEERFRITRAILEIIEREGVPCHILTKSKLILRDIDILSKMSNCLVTISIISLKEQVSNIFEKDVPYTVERLSTIKQLSENGIKTGLAVIPILPFIVEEELEEIVKLAQKNNAQYLLHKHLELKGDQRQIFMKTLSKFYPDFVEKYEKLYGNSYTPNNAYILKIKSTIDGLCNKYGVKNKI